MGYFATLETPSETPTDIKEDDSCGTRRSTRKRKPALHEGLYNKKIEIECLLTPHFRLCSINFTS